MAPPRHKFGISLDPESLQNFERFYLSIAVFSGRKDPNADVIQIQISGLKNENWETVGRIGIYRDGQEYRELPPIKPPEPKQETIDISKDEIKEGLSDDSEDDQFL